MSSTSRPPLISTRVRSDRKAAFAALASRRGLSESALLALMIGAVVDTNGTACREALPMRSRLDRVSIRLHAGDGARIALRASSRGLAPATYLSALVRAHVSADPPLPLSEIAVLKQAVGRLSAIDRHLGRLAGAGAPTDELHRLLLATAACTGEARRTVADVVRTNLQSWEAPDV